MNQNKPLTHKQEAFARNYVANGFNATQAAISAGYSQDSAESKGSQLLRFVKVANLIEQLGMETTKRANASADDVFEMLTDALFLDLSEWYEVKSIEVITKAGTKYNRSVMILSVPLSELPKRVRRLATNIKETMSGVEVSWFSKEKAAEMLARFHGMNKDSLKVENPHEGKSVEELAAILKAKREAGIE